MATCPYADDAYLVQHWPGVVARTGEVWLVSVASAVTGLYSVTMQGLPYEYLATAPPDDPPAVRNGLLVPLGLQVVAAAAPQGLAGLVLREVVQPGQVPAGLAVSVAGPAPDVVAAALVSGGDANAALRLHWLEAVKCSLPACGPCGVTCAADFTMMHAALAAHWLFVTAPGNVGSTGAGANNFDSMRLGPASLTKGGKSKWGKGADAALGELTPGELYLMLRAKYLLPVMCA